MHAAGGGPHFDYMEYEDHASAAVDWKQPLPLPNTKQSHQHAPQDMNRAAAGMIEAAAANPFSHGAVR